MSKSFADEFIKDSPADRFVLPEEFSSRFDILECLANNPLCDTYLLSEKNGGGRYVLKCYSKSLMGGEPGEAKLLSSISHSGLPAFEAESENESVVFVLREYAEGIPLDHYLEEHGNMDVSQAVHVVTELCGVLSYLHSQTPPIIHRDIKPSNIVFDPDSGKVTLIDFGISRRYSESSETDTMNLGTKKFAPPEQYGFAQTDCRADIYALGVLLRFMLTGDVDGVIEDKKLERIAAKCSAFSPKDRYSNTSALKHALLSLTGFRRYFKHILVSIAALVVIISGLFVYNWLQDPPTPQDPPIYEDFLSRDSITLSVDAQRTSLTRGEVCKVLVDNLGIYDEYAESGFSDVPPEHPLYRYISSAAQARIVQGSGGPFDPDGEVTPAIYAILVMERALGIYQVAEGMTDWDEISKAAARAGNNYGIVTDEQLRQSNADPEVPMMVVAEGILIPILPFGSWVEWESSDESVAVVDSGQITPVSPGTATITAHYRRGLDTVADTCVVTVIMD